jgi:hypothetical protein
VDYTKATGAIQLNADAIADTTTGAITAGAATLRAAGEGELNGIGFVTRAQARSPRALVSWRVVGAAAAAGRKIP